MQRIGIAGIGNISGVYLSNLTGAFGGRVKVTAAADILPERAQKAADDYGAQIFRSTEEMIEKADVDIILNLTQPRFHFEIAMAAVRAGKHVYNEKPLCVTREQAAELLKAAAEHNVRVGGAPDTFLGAGLQTCRGLIDDGSIGRPVAAAAFMMTHGCEDWHPAPEFYYKTGGGPMFDMGPYYLCALVSLLGPAVRISGSAQTGIKTRTITSEPLRGTQIDVEVPTHISASIDFASGAVATIITSFEICSHTLPFIEIYGTGGTLRVPDPNFFGGPVFLRRMGEEQWTEVPLHGAYSGNMRGIGITDMAEAIEEKRPHRASAEMAFHVLEIMHGIHDASASDTYYRITSTCDRPEPL